MTNATVNMIWFLGLAFGPALIVAVVMEVVLRRERKGSN